MFAKQRIELIIERMAYKRACRILEESGLTGYTVVPALAGFGGGSKWQRDTDISSSRDMVVIISIGSQARIDEAVAALGMLLSRHIGVVSVTDVRVLRDFRF